MESYLAVTFAADFRRGGRFHLMERMSGGGPVPIPSVGDSMSVQPNVGPDVPGRIVSVHGNTFVLELGDGVRLEFKPTPRDFGPSPLITDMPTIDMLATVA